MAINAISIRSFGYTLNKRQEFKDSMCLFTISKFLTAQQTAICCHCGIKRTTLAMRFHVM